MNAGSVPALEPQYTQTVRIVLMRPICHRVPTSVKARSARDATRDVGAVRGKIESRELASTRFFVIGPMDRC
jgi:hypothetical protein